jgi:hypothetical protein
MIESVHIIPLAMIDLPSLFLIGLLLWAIYCIGYWIYKFSFYVFSKFTTERVALFTAVPIGVIVALTVLWCVVFVIMHSISYDFS